MGAELAALARLAAPLFAGQLAVVGLSITDLVLAGHAGRADVAGVVLGATLFELPLMFVVGVFAAGAALAGRLHGRGDFEGLAAHLRDCLGLALPTGAALCLLVLALRGLLLPALELADPVRAVASGYLLPMAATAALLPALIALRTTLEAAGHPQVAMALNLAGFFANIPLDLAFIHGAGPLPALGGAGCGWATLIVVAGILAGLGLWAHRPATPAHLHFLARPAAPRWPALGRLLLLGTPMGGAILAEAGFFYAIPLLAAPLGTLPLAAHAVALSLDFAMFIAPLALGQAVTIRTAAALGRGAGNEARRSVRAGLAAALGLGLLQALAVAAARRHVAALYAPDAEVAELAARLLAVAGRLGAMEPIVAVWWAILAAVAAAAFLSLGFLARLLPRGGDLG
ncbi:MAG: hypothetical protein KatS3mg124_1522 [Porticoccaceae bacterium]|nr:MAG: hypothetical protein KatS3mg124_1522 [Porticoccaceae bacterium]